MSSLYGPGHRALQERFDTRRLADNVEKRVVLTEIPPEHKTLIESRDMFFLSTIDHQGRPTVSYKGGDPGFVRVLDNKTIAFPCYDGNGMFYSMGNLMGNGQVGMLFIDFEKPHRLRLQGIASVDDGDPLLQNYAEAQFDPPSLKWSDLKYVFWHQGGPICRGGDSSLKRLLPS
jgi:predicted pyridoxine 5'-phosphate oxidase superfamily flavin-nucleotide-binding protein